MSDCPRTFSIGLCDDARPFPASIAMPALALRPFALRSFIGRTAGNCRNDATFCVRGRVSGAEARAHVGQANVLGRDLLSP